MFSSTTLHDQEQATVNTTGAEGDFKTRDSSPQRRECFAWHEQSAPLKHHRGKSARRSSFSLCCNPAANPLSRAQSPLYKVECTAGAKMSAPQAGGRPICIASSALAGGRDGKRLQPLTRENLHIQRDV